MTESFYTDDLHELYLRPSVRLGIPLGFAVITGLLVSAVIAACFYWWLPDAWIPLTAISGTISALIAWGAAHVLYWIRESDTLANLYALQSGQYASAQPVQIWEKSQDGRTLSTDPDQPPFTRYQWEAIARVVVGGGSITYRAMSGILSSESDVAALQIWMVEKGHAYWRVEGVPQQGIQVTQSGREYFQNMYDQLRASPTPDSSSIQRYHTYSTHTHDTGLDE